MANIPLSIKYRPKKLSEVIGQEVVVRTLTNAFKAKNLHHAYIFAGAFGCGKTTTGRILAAMENCLTNKNGDPCGECSNCKAIFLGKSQDIIETNAASERGIDDVRAIQDLTKYAPINCRVRYVILDESHSLSSAAAEAALKMIEEPPPNVRFILATTEAHALKPTIQSRCEFLKFCKVGWFDLYNHIISVAKQEKVQIDEAAAKLAARASKGSVRNSLQNLQTIIDYAGENTVITADIAAKALGLVDDNAYFLMSEAIVKKDAFSAVKSINQLLSEGKQADQIVNGLSGHLRLLLLAKTCPKVLPSMDVTSDEIKRIEHQVSSIQLGVILEMVSGLTNIYRGFNVNLDPQLLLETFVIDSIIAVTKIEKASK